MKRVVIRIYGKVQGVFVRANAQEKASELGLTGWVRNEEDGTVLIIAEGQEVRMKEFLNWFQDGGPEFAEIDKIDVEWKKGTGEFNSFKIMY